MAVETKEELPFEHLIRALQEGEARRISECIQDIDRRLLNCRKAVEEYRQLRSTLRSINGQLSRLGAEPMAVSEEFPGEDLNEIIVNRIAHFKTTGKI